MKSATHSIAHVDPAKLPASSLARLYDPETEANSFALDGFPSLTSGSDWLSRLVEIIETQGPLSMTTNQTLFRQLIETGVLDDRFRALKAQGKKAADVYQVLYNEEATAAAGAFSAVHSMWPSEGRVSQEASALLTEMEPLVQEVWRIAKAMESIGSFTKIPNLQIGPQAIRKAVHGGEIVQKINPNITLVFSDRHYLRTVEGYLVGLANRVGNLKLRGADKTAIGRDIAAVRSVNSLFVSRVDRVVDPMIDGALKTAGEPARKRLSLLKGKTAVAQAKIIARMFEAIFLGRPFQDSEGLYADAEGKELTALIGELRLLYVSLGEWGVHPQRLLIASTGVKSDQPYSPLLYVLPFLGAWSANTMPEPTLEASSRFVAGLSDEEIASLKKRNIIQEPLPAVPADVKPISLWDEAVLMTSGQRKARGIAEVTPDEVLRDVKALVLEPAKTSLRAICDTLRDKGAASFMADEQAILQLIETKLQKV